MNTTTAETRNSKPETQNPKLTFEFQGQTRTLNKHPRIQAQLKTGQITETAARQTPWILRLTVTENGQKFQRAFTLSTEDPAAIAQAKQHLKSNGSTDFQNYLQARAAKRSQTIGQLAEEWLKLQMPDATGHPRTETARANLEHIITSARRYWEKIIPATITQATVNEFATWRRKDCLDKGRGTGDRSTDIELSALSCLLSWAASLEKIEKNPIAKRPTYQRAEAITHCHEHAPDTDEQWHNILSHLFTHTPTRDKPHATHNLTLTAQRMRVIGAWLAFTGLTGLRPEEPQFLYRYQEQLEPPGNPAKLPPGTIFTTREGKKMMRIQRGKNGQNPFVLLHPALLDFLAHWQQYLDTTFVIRHSSLARPWFPNPAATSEPIFQNGDFTPLIRRLTEACESLKQPRLKPKGFGRAYYVRVRRSQGADDSVIASELGQTTNGKLIRDTYGNPEDMAGGALFDWLPESKLETPNPKPSWHLLNSSEQTTTNIIHL